MDIQEQIYTSAAELLDSVSSNLGVIAQTRGFPKDLEADLVAHRSYTLRSQDIERNACPPRFAISACGPQKANLVISRVSFAGADHTGRTRPFSHHLAVRRQEMQGRGVSPSVLATAALQTLRAEWQGAPSWLDAQSLDAHAADLHADALPSRAWSKLIPPIQVSACLVSIADALVTVPATRQPVVVCIPADSAAAVMEMMADILTLIPPSIQWSCVCVSHVVDMGDNLRDAALTFTYPDTPFLTRCRERHDARRPLVFDLTRTDTLPQQPTGAYAQALLPSVNGQDFRQIVSTVRQWDEWGMMPEAKELFNRAVRLRERMAVAQPDSDLPVIAAEVSDLAGASMLRPKMDDWAMELLRKSLLNRSDDARWPAIAKFACDARWPTGARGLAFDELAKHSDHSLASLFSDGANSNTVIDVATRELLHRLPDNPNVANNAVRLAIAQPTEAYLRFAEAVMQHAKAPFDTVLGWWDLVAASNPVVQQQLVTPLVSQLARTARTGKEIAVMRERSHTAKPNATFNQDVYCRVLRGHFDTSSNEDVRRQLAELLMGVALHSESIGAAGSELHGLLKVPKPGITRQQVEAWLQQARGTCQETELQRAAVESRIISGGVPEAPARRADIARHELPVRITPLPSRSISEPAAMRVGRNWAVLPPWSIHVLSIFVIGIALGLGGLHLVVPWRIPVPPLIMRIIVAGIAFVLWMTSVGVNQFASSDQNRLRLAFTMRWVVAVLLIVLLTFEVSFLLPHLGRWWP